jgi:hypothetical protein
MSGALEGIRVIDFGQYLPGPLTTMLLADAGADVIRIDPPGGPLWRHHANVILQRANAASSWTFASQVIASWLNGSSRPPMLSSRISGPASWTASVSARGPAATPIRS